MQATFELYVCKKIIGYLRGFMFSHSSCFQILIIMKNINMDTIIESMIDFDSCSRSKGGAKMDAPLYLSR
jgi:hypothetical protein